MLLVHDWLSQRLFVYVSGGAECDRDEKETTQSALHIQIVPART